MHGIALILRAGRRMETIPIYDALIQELLSKGSLEEANKYFKVQKAILLAAGRPAEAAFKAAEIGARCLRFHYLQQGIAFLDGGEKLYRKLGEPQMLGKVLNEIGNALQEMEDFKSARMRQREALSLARKTRDRVLEAQTRNNLGELERRAGNYQAAVSELRKTASICKSLHDLDGLATAYNNLGLAYDGLEKINIAKQMFGESLKVAIASGDKASQARAISSQGSLIFDRGRFNLALVKFKRALQLAQKSSDKDLEAQMWLNVAFTELRLKKDRHANRSLQKAVDLAQDTRNNKLLAEICLASAKENVRSAEVKKSGEYLAASVILSLVISPQYAASSLQQLFVLVRELITEKNDDSAKNMLENAIKHLRKFKDKASRRLVNFYLLPMKNYLSQSEREPFERFIVRTALEEH
jgi:tetratricopeptide (TPR) repeat protein